MPDLKELIQIERFNAEHPTLHFTENNECFSLHDITHCEWKVGSDGTPRLRMFNGKDSTMTCLSSSESMQAWHKWLACKHTTQCPTPSV